MTKPTSAPLISIVSCIYNQNKFVQDLIDSVEKQTHSNFEHVIIEGGSTDGTVEKLDSYAKRPHQYAVRIYTFPPKGISDAMNKGVELAQGEWIIVVHGDDYLEDAHSTARMQNEIDRNQNSCWLVGNFVRNYFGITYNTHTYLIRPLLYRLLLHGVNLISHQNMLMKKELFLKYGVFDTKFTTHMDTDLYLRLLENRVYPTTVNSSFTVLRRHIGAASIRPDVYFSSLANLQPRLKSARKNVKWK